MEEKTADNDFAERNLEPRNILSKYLKTRISDITKNNYGGFTGHYLVELSIIEEHDDHS